MESACPFGTHLKFEVPQTSIIVCSGLPHPNLQIQIFKKVRKIDILICSWLLHPTGWEQGRIALWGHNTAFISDEYERDVWIMCWNCAEALPSKCEFVELQYSKHQPKKMKSTYNSHLIKWKDKDDLTYAFFDWLWYMSSLPTIMHCK